MGKTFVREKQGWQRGEGHKRYQGEEPECLACTQKITEIKFANKGKSLAQ